MADEVRGAAQSEDDQPTCGKGVAANAVLPGKLADLTAARAEVLERHTKALDLTDPAAQQELDGYARVTRAHRTASAALRDLAAEMEACRDLPMGRHDLAIMMDPNGQMAAFRRFVEIERELISLLQTRLQQDEAKLG